MSLVTCIHVCYQNQSPMTANHASFDTDMYARMPPPKLDKVFSLHAWNKVICVQPMIHNVFWQKLLTIITTMTHSLMPIHFAPANNT